MRKIMISCFLFVSSQSFATGPDETMAEILSSVDRTASVDTNHLVCISGSAFLSLTDLGPLRETSTLSSVTSDSCTLASEIKTDVQTMVQLQFMLYRETPIDWMTGEPTGAPSYFSCVTIAKFANGLVVSAWYWNPKNPSSCR